MPVAIGATAVLFSALTLIQPLAPSPEANSMTVVSVDTQVPPAPITTLPETVGGETDITKDLERIDYLGELVAITDLAELDDAALANLFF